MESQSDEFQIFYQLGRTQFSQRNTGGAISSFRKAVELDPEHSHAHAYLGLCHLRNGDLIEALPELETSLRLDPSDPWIHVNLGIALAQKDRGRAREHFLRGIELSPEYAEAHAKYGWFCRHFGTRAERKRVEELYRKAMELDPEDADYPAALAEHLFDKRQRADEAKELAEQSLALAPDAEDAHVLLGFLDLAAGKRERAHEHALSALRAAPESEEAIRLLISVKSSGSRLLGLWWRVSHLLGRRYLTASRWSAFILFSAANRVLRAALRPYGTHPVAVAILLLYVSFVVYLVFANIVFERMVRRELKQVRLVPEF